MDQLIFILEKYKYLALFPLAAIEGPIASLAVGFLVFLGYLNFLPAYAILILGDIVPDSIYYYLGRYGNKNKLVERFGARVTLISKSFGVVERIWREHGVKTMFFGKLAYGFSIPFLISAGLVRMPYRRFMALALPVTLLQYGIIMALGYYLGHSYQLAEAYIQNAYIIIAAALAVFIAGYILISRYARKEVKEIEKDTEESM